MICVGSIGDKNIITSFRIILCGLGSFDFATAACPTFTEFLVPYKKPEFQNFIGHGFENEN